jgi:hypothetical protein
MRRPQEGNPEAEESAVATKKSKSKRNLHKSKKIGSTKTLTQVYSPCIFDK